MPVASFRELARTTEGELGSGTVARRRFIVILDDNATVTATTNNDILNAVAGGTYGTAHPELTFLRLRKAAVSENFNDNPYHVEVTVEYGLVPNADLTAPTSRPATWTYESVPGDQIPALYWYESNNVKRPLVNSAFDYFEGLTVQESLTRVTIVKNYAARPSALIDSFGYINSDQFSGAAVHHCKHEGSKIEQVTSEWGNLATTYWKAESQILFRPTGWNLQLPDVGYNFLSGGQKRRCMVFDFQNSEWIPSPTPVGLYQGFQTNSWPDILERRVVPDISFVGLFGDPPA